MSAWRFLRWSLEALTALAVLTTLAIAVLALFGARAPSLDAVTHFRPFMAAGTAVLLLVVLLLRPRYRKAMLTLTLAAFALHALPVALEVQSAYSRDVPDAEAPAGTASLRVMTFNMWGGNDEAEPLIAYVRDEGIDILMLEEAFPGHADLVARLQNTLPYRADCIGRRSCNVAILSRYPITEHRVYDRRWTDTGTWSAPIVVARVAPVAQDRTSDLTVIATHLSWPLPAAQQQAQFRELSDVVQDLGKDRVILAGDFNSTPWSGAFARFEESLPLTRVTRALPTWPSPNLRRPILNVPFLAIDHVFVGTGLAATSVRRGPPTGSDHYPVIVDLEARLSAAR